MKKKLRQIVLVLLCVLTTAQMGLAAEELSVARNIVKEDMLYAYMKNPGNYDEVRCQIGMEYSPNVVVKDMENPDISVDTYILIDNSLSIQDKYRDTLKQVAKDIVFSGKNNESFTIATFDTEIHYLLENSQDSKTLIDTIDQIEFQNLDTQVINVLYHLYEKIEDNDENSFKRIIFMSDGVETKTIGYTKEELIGKAKECGYPVYVLGCAYKSNETELENMFRISRETNAEYYFLDDVESADQVAAGIASSFDIVRVQAEIPENQRDGSSKGIRIVFTTEDGEKSAIYSQRMPFLAKNNTEDMTEELSETEHTVTEQIETEHAVTEVMTEQTITEQTITEQVVTELAITEQAITEIATEQVTEVLSEQITEQNPESGSETAERNRLIAIVSISVFACIAVVILIIILFRKKEGKRNTEKEELKNKEQKETFSSDSTEWLGNESKTPSQEVINIRLTDTKRPSVMAEYPLVSSVIVGRIADKSQIVFDYEKSVSAQHCEISRIQNRIYIKDLNSVNATYVNGKIVEEKVELTDGSVIKMGRLMVKFEVINPEEPGNSERKSETGTEFIFDI